MAPTAQSPYTGARPGLLVITGPTASGKTRRAVELARAWGRCEIVSADSRQVYRGMDLGTGKDLAEYGQVPVHLIDICPAGYRYNLFEYLRDCREAIAGIRERGNTPVLCGGTGLYVESVLKGLELPPVPEDPGLRLRLRGKSLDELAAMLASMKTLHNVTDIDTAQRAVRAIEIQEYYINHPEAASQARPHPLADALVIGVDVDRDTRRSRITRRLKERLDQGMVDEVRRLIGLDGIAPDDLMYYGLEYKYLTLHVTGQLSLAEMTSQLETAIHQFAKRQMTWLRGMERRVAQVCSECGVPCPGPGGKVINWLPSTLTAGEFTQAVSDLAAQCSGCKPL